jgi:Zn finger protein HypA/HybF involved in hydrogenase expression
MKTEVMIRCKSCHLLYEGIELKGLCPKCRSPFLAVAATYPHVKEENEEEKDSYFVK